MKFLKNPAIQAMAFAILALCGTAAQAADSPFPNHPVNIIVPYLPGGTPDIMARVLAPKLSAMWGQPVIVENRAGANGSIGSAHVAKSKADGHTLVLGTTATHVVNGLLYRTMPYDGVKDFAPVAMIGTLSNVLVVNPQIPAKSVKELIALLKAQPDKYTYGSGGNGSSNHLAAEMFKSMAGVSMLHIPYKSAAPALTGLMAGQTSMIFENVSTALPHIQSGALRALGVTSAQGSRALPGVPSINDAGLPGYDMSFWYGLLAPANTPPETVAKINKDVMSVLAMPDVRKNMEDRGIDMKPNSPDEFSKYMRAEVPKWTKVVKDSGAKLD